MPMVKFLRCLECKETFPNRKEIKDHLKFKHGLTSRKDKLAKDASVPLSDFYEKVYWED